MNKVDLEDKMYEEWCKKRYDNTFNRYKRMIKELFNIDEELLCSKRKQTLTLRYVRTIYYSLCFEKGVPYMDIGKSINRTSNVTLHHIKLYKDLYKCDAYFKYLADMALSWDKRN